MKYSLLLIMAASLMLASCKKEGCTDPDSTTYNPEAKKDDGTCRYETTLVFWTDNLPDGSINVTVDGKFIGNIGVTFTSAPECGQTGALTYTIDLGTSKSKSVHVELEDDLYIWDYTDVFMANTCHKEQL